MNRLYDALTNPFLIAGISSWISAQTVKAIIYALVNKKFDIKRLFGDGGMPSGHSATVTSLALMSGFIKGFGSFEFAIAFIFAIVVCHDATGVRQETGKQAILLNEIVKSFEVFYTEKLPKVKLKEFVGHTPIQVAAGILLGAVNAIFVYNVLL